MVNLDDFVSNDVRLPALDVLAAAFGFVLLVSRQAHCVSPFPDWVYSAPFPTVAAGLYDV
jgi:hypothetical protein